MDSFWLECSFVRFNLLFALLFIGSSATHTGSPIKAPETPPPDLTSASPKSLKGGCIIFFILFFSHETRIQLTYHYLVPALFFLYFGAVFL